MDRYAQVAINTIYNVKTTGNSPDYAWKLESERTFGKGTALAKKGCPKGTFLGLCEEGLIKDIPKGQYTKSIKNKKYAVDAVNLIKTREQGYNNPKSLWIEVAGNDKVPNHQMDIVCALCSAGLLEI